MKIHYHNDIERESSIEEQESNGMRLVEDAITFDDGNYLIFEEAES